MNALIIEDEARSARELAQLIMAADPSVVIAGTLESVEQSLAWLAVNAQPDVIFSDIQLADGLSFDLFEKVAFTCPVIFCTAFDAYLMDAFETNAISYLLKPLTREKVSAALNKLKRLRGVPASTPLTLQNLIGQLCQPYKSTLLINQREKIIPLATGNIAYCYMEHSIVEVSTLQQQKYFLSGSLDELGKTLDPTLFSRANRRFLVGRSAIASAERFFSRKLALKRSVDTPEAIISSKAKASEFLDWLEYRHS